MRIYITPLDSTNAIGRLHILKYFELNDDVFFKEVLYTETPINTNSTKLVEIVDRYGLVDIIYRTENLA
jgi:hypothetical protein